MSSGGQNLIILWSQEESGVWKSLLGEKSPEPGAAEGRSLSRVGAARRGFQHPSWIAPEARAPHAAAHGAVGGVRPASAPLLEETRFVVSFLSLRESVQRLTHRSVLQYRRPVRRRSCGLSLNSSGHATLPRASRVLGQSGQVTNQPANRPCAAGSLRTVARSCSSASCRTVFARRIGAELCLVTDVFPRSPLPASGYVIPLQSGHRFISVTFDRLPG